MNWYYVENGQQAGPVNDTQFAELINRGVVQADTLVWHEGWAEWKPYGQAATPAPEAPPIVEAPPVAIPGGVTCAECGRLFAPTDVIRYQDKWVCAACKPVFFQRLREGAAPSLAAGAGGLLSETDLLARDYDVPIGDYFERAWALFKENAGIMIGAGFLIFLCRLGIGVVPYMSWILALVFTGPLMGGLWFLYIKVLRRENPTVGDAFVGFGPRFGQLFLVQLVPSLIGFAWAIPVGMFAALLLPVAARHHSTFFDASSFAGPVIAGFIVLFFVFLAVAVYLGVCWRFALALVADKGMAFWPALQLSRRVVQKHWWMTFLLVLVCVLFTMVGAFACLVGLLVTAPMGLAMQVCHYERVFGDLAPARRW